MIKYLALVFILVVGGCASTAAKSYVGKPIEEAYFELGPPENIFDLSDGRKAFQYRWGGGTYALPGQATTHVTGNLYSATARTIYTPAQVIESKGCLITLLARQNSKKSWVVEEYRIPKKLVC